ncbi:Na/Pi cotransporter family protein [Methylobacillus flagellatus]|uniref:Na+/Pi-cotransporter n=1 Tax=Methylobacillus flagellatus (strain ATCC 51484 / DSM 6875 / VKM B-1610 / KT) TaxID=265072 RepID=Q1H0J8_METFK|nr:Na/Pi symporter [Methylobacillus flagellatus]ABE49989.1 Na+/Pi-cotransporter [Methylobacillus flagellatus KT]
MWSDLFMGLGAIGLMLLGIDWMTRGLKTAAGPSFMQLLQRWTGTPLQGIFIGSVSTLAVQSSTAVTVATIGFANANILSLSAAAFIIYGSNLGSSLSAWLVAVVGGGIKLDDLALPILGIAVMLKLLSKHSRRQGIGEALTGFALLFLGLGYLKTSFDSAFINIDFAFLTSLGVWGILLSMLAGILLTVVMQASLAVVALVVTAVSTGAVPLEIGAAVVIGANVGTTSTALLATLAATATAKRVASLHVLFNVLTAIVALLLLKPLLWGIQEIAQLLFHDTQPQFILALFHTMFNALGVVLMYPLTPPLLRWLETKFKAPTYQGSFSLDQSSLAIPSLAIKAMSLEGMRAGQLIARLALTMGRHHELDAQLLEDNKQILQNLHHYIAQLAQQSMSAEEAELLNQLVQNQLRLSMALQLLPALARHLDQDPAAFELEIPYWQALSDSPLPPDSAALRHAYRQFIRERQQKKQRIVQDVLHERRGQESGGDDLLKLAETRRFNQQLTKALLAFGKLQSRFDQPESIVEAPEESSGQPQTAA